MCRELSRCWWRWLRSLPVFNYAPKLYLWFVRQRVRRLYRRLRLVMREMGVHWPMPSSAAAQLPVVSLVAAA